MKGDNSFGLLMLGLFFYLSVMYIGEHADAFARILGH